MRKMMKTLFVSIASLSLMFSVSNAGELSVSGTAKATYHITNGSQADNTIGITNEMNLCIFHCSYLYILCCYD